MIKVMELVEQYKNKRIEKYETELRHRVIIETNPAIQELRQSSI